MDGPSGPRPGAPRSWGPRARGLQTSFTEVRGRERERGRRSEKGGEGEQGEKQRSLKQQDSSEVAWGPWSGKGALKQQRGPEAAN